MLIYWYAVVHAIQCMSPTSKSSMSIRVSVTLSNRCTTFCDWVEQKAVLILNFAHTLYLKPDLKPKRSECGNRISSANFLIAFHGNYGSSLLSFWYVTENGRTTDRRRQPSHIWPLMRAFSVAGPSTWTLPADIRLSENILTFKRQLKTHLFEHT